VSEGITMPASTRQMLSSLIASYRTPALVCGVVPYVSSFFSNFPAALPKSTPPAACAASMFLSVLAHIALAAWILKVRVYRNMTSNVLGAAGLLLTAAFHAQMASGFEGGVSATLTMQAALCLIRSAAAVATGLVERQVAADPAVGRSEPVWAVGDGGGDDEKREEAQPTRPASIDSAPPTGSVVGTVFDTVMSVMLAEPLLEPSAASSQPQAAAQPEADVPAAGTAPPPAAQSDTASSGTSTDIDDLLDEIFRAADAAGPAAEPAEGGGLPKENSDLNLDELLGDGPGGEEAAVDSSRREERAAGADDEDELSKLYRRRSIVGTSLVIDEFTAAPANPFGTEAPVASARATMQAGPSSQPLPPRAAEVLRQLFSETAARSTIHADETL
jgi:hypothetical protein